MAKAHATDQTVYPNLHYRNAEAAMRFVCDVFGFELHVVYRNNWGGIDHAELRYGASIILIGSVPGYGDATAKVTASVGASWLYVIVDDAVTHHARVVAAGAEIIRELEDQDYGAREYSARDSEGNIWSFRSMPSLAGPRRLKGPVRPRRTLTGGATPRAAGGGNRALAQTKDGLDRRGSEAHVSQERRLLAQSLSSEAYLRGLSAPARPCG